MTAGGREFQVAGALNDRLPISVCLNGTSRPMPLSHGKTQVMNTVSKTGVAIKRGVVLWTIFVRCLKDT